MSSPADAAPLAPELLVALLADGCRVRVRVTGASMGPSLRDGDLVVLQRLEPPRARIGDLLLARGEGTLVLHRLVGRPRLTGGARGYQLKGDALAAADDPVPAERLLARVVAVCRGRGPRAGLETGLDTPGRRVGGLLLAAASRCAPRLLRLAAGRGGAFTLYSGPCQPKR